MCAMRNRATLLMHNAHDADHTREMRRITRSCETREASASTNRRCTLHHGQRPVLACRETCDSVSSSPFLSFPVAGKYVVKSEFSNKTKMSAIVVPVVEHVHGVARYLVFTRSLARILFSELFF